MTIITNGDAVERTFREAAGRAVATLVRAFGDIDIAEEAVQEAFTVAWEKWPIDGVPPSPAGWIVTTARNRAIDRLRRESSRDWHAARGDLLERLGHQGAAQVAFESTAALTDNPVERSLLNARLSSGRR